MSRSLSGQFQIDRDDPPREFFTPSRKVRIPSGRVLVPGVDVLAESAAPQHGMLSLGVVSKQTPFGQGTVVGFGRETIRRATAAEIRAALAEDHPAGDRFRPRCNEVLYLSAILDGAPATAPDRPMLMFARTASRDTLRTEAHELNAAHRGLLRRWSVITKRQTIAVLATLH